MPFQGAIAAQSRRIHQQMLFASSTNSSEKTQSKLRWKRAFGFPEESSFLDFRNIRNF